MDDLAARGFTGVLHTMSENDLAYYRDTLGRIVEISHAAGLFVQVGPWGLGRTFGGEAESLFVANHPHVGQVLDSGRPVAAGCLNSEAYREFVRSWAAAAVETGADRIFWDEPHWAHPAHFDEPLERWGCRCPRCVQRWCDETGDDDMPTELTAEVRVFRERCLVEFLGELIAYVAGLGGRSTVCLLPQTSGSLGVADWSAVARLPGVATLATDPYWQAFERARRPVRDRVLRTGGAAGRRRRHRPPDLDPGLPSRPRGRRRHPRRRGRRPGRRRRRPLDLGLRSLRPHELPRHPGTRAGLGDPLRRPDHPDRPARRRRSVIRAHTVAQERQNAVGGASRILPLLRGRPRWPRHRAGAAGTRRPRPAAHAGTRPAHGRGGGGGGRRRPAGRAGHRRRHRRHRRPAHRTAEGRLIYVGAGTAGRMGVLDAAECGPTFDAADTFVALMAGGPQAVTKPKEGAEDDPAAGAAELRALGVGAADAVVGISASGRTPYVLGRPRRRPGRRARSRSACPATPARSSPPPPTMPSRSWSAPRSSPAPPA